MAPPGPPVPSDPSGHLSKPHWAHRSTRLIKAFKLPAPWEGSIRIQFLVRVLGRFRVPAIWAGDLGNQPQNPQRGPGHITIRTYSQVYIGSMKHTSSHSVRIFTRTYTWMMHTCMCAWWDWSMNVPYHCVTSKTPFYHIRQVTRKIRKRPGDGNGRFPDLYRFKWPKHGRSNLYRKKRKSMAVGQNQQKLVAWGILSSWQKLHLPHFCLGRQWSTRSTPPPEV